MMTFWNLLFFKEQRLPQVAAQSVEWNRGAYLSEALGHCAECHTPRNVLMALKDQPFAGAKLQGWHAYNLTPEANSGIGGWSETDIVSYLSTGKLAGKAAAAGPMAEVIENSTQDLISWRGTNHVASSGALLFNANCASCHSWKGDGAAAELAGGYPALSHNSTTGAADADNLTMVILNGVHRRSATADVFMPAFRAELDDADIAALSNYVSSQFGNPQAKQTAEGVAKARAAK